MDLLSNQSRVTRMYYNAQSNNRTSQSVPAKYSATLSKPLISDPNNGWNLAINRFRIPLSGIPLTPDNIPFQTWQVALGYSAEGTTTYKSAYVPQYGEKFSSLYDYVLNTNASGVSFITKGTYLNGIFTSVSSFTLGPLTGTPIMASNGTYIAVGATGTTKITISFFF